MCVKFFGTLCGLRHTQTNYNLIGLAGTYLDLYVHWYVHIKHVEHTETYFDLVSTPPKPHVLNFGIFHSLFFSEEKS